MDKILKMDISNNDMSFYKRYMNAYSVYNSIYKTILKYDATDIKRPKFNYASKYILIINSCDYKQIEEVLKKENILIEDLLISFYDKSSDDELNDWAINKEIDRLTKRKFISIDIEIEDVYYLKMKNISNFFKKYRERFIWKIEK